MDTHITRAFTDSVCTARRCSDVVTGDAAQVDEKRRKNTLPTLAVVIALSKDGIVQASSRYPYIITSSGSHQ
jgi:hypothetical protein